QMVLRFGLCRSEPWPRVESAVRKEIGSFAVPVIGARPRDNVNDASRRSPEFGTDVAGQDLILLDRTLGEFERHEKFRFRKIGEGLVGVSSVNQPVGIEMIHA